MRVGIDYTAAVWQGAGIGRYTRELVRAVIALGGAFEYRLFYAAGGLAQDSRYVVALRELCATFPNVSAVPIPISPRRLTQVWQRLRVPLPVEVFTGPLDLVHAPDFVLPPTRARTILTIHDLSFLVHPECAAPGMQRYLARAVPRGVRRADVVLVDSQATRQDVLRFLGVDAGRVQVVYPGVGGEFRPLSAEVLVSVRQRLGLPAQFLLFVSTIEPRKNLVRLLEAFARVDPGVLAAAGPSDGVRGPLALVIAGRRGWLYDEVFAAVQRLQLDQRVHWLDFVDDRDLPALYNLAWAFVYPSIYEGFGLPALEALACGTPVVTADNSSLPEVVGDAAVLVRADDCDSIADGIRQVIEDSALRRRLRAGGFERASLFTWEQAARLVVDCYEACGSVSC